MEGWLSDEEWFAAEKKLPIVCVDALPVKLTPGESGVQVGLILRETPHQGQRWCLLGGRVLHAEPLYEALHRQWHSALGESLVLSEVLLASPKVVEYRPDALPGRPHDPRKHAVSITYTVWTEGVGLATGTEAVEFRWFRPDEISEKVMGFGQENVVRDILSRSLKP